VDYWTRHALLAHSGEFKTLLKEEMHLQAAGFSRSITAPLPGLSDWATTSAFPIQEAHRNLLLLCALQRLAAFRKSLLRTIQITVMGVTPEDDLLITDTVLNVKVNNAPPHTVCSLSASLSIFLNLDREKTAGRWEATYGGLGLHDPLSPAVSTDRRVRLHRLAEEWEDLFARWGKQGQAGGSAFEATRLSRTQAWTFELASSTGVQVRALRLAGIHASEELVVGLLALPGYRPVADVGLKFSLTDFIQNASAQWCSPDASGCTPSESAIRLAKTEAKRRRQLSIPRYDDRSIYSLQAFAGVEDSQHPDCREKLVISPLGEPLNFADPNDILGQRPSGIPMPDLRKLKRDIPRLARTSAAPFAAVQSPPDSAYRTGELPADTSIQFGLGMICTYGIPVFTICAMVLFQIVFNILSKLPPFSWMMSLILCFPTATAEEP
jgi:hypothetical protein